MLPVTEDHQVQAELVFAVQKKHYKSPVHISYIVLPSLISPTSGEIRWWHRVLVLSPKRSVHFSFSCAIEEACKSIEPPFMTSKSSSHRTTCLSSSYAL